MLIWFSARRLALLAAGVFIIGILIFWRTAFEEFLPRTNLPGPFQSHNGKGRPADGTVNTPTIPITHLYNETIPSPLPHDTHEEILAKVQKLRSHWAPPAISNHWPPYDQYGWDDYDPNLWEGFDWDHNFYIRNGIKRLMKEKPYAAKLLPYLPYPDYNNAEWRKEWQGQYVPCKGARGKLLSESKDDWVLAYSAVPDGFPQPAVGDAQVGLLQQRLSAKGQERSPD